MTYPSDYDTSPPVVRFMTIPFHPNVHPITGQPCIDWLDSKQAWLEVCSKYGTPSPESIALHLRSMLGNPTNWLQSPANADAAAMITSDPDKYVAIARECVAASQRVKRGLAPFEGYPTDPFALCVRPSNVTHPSLLSSLFPLSLFSLSFCLCLSLSVSQPSVCPSRSLFR